MGLLYARLAPAVFALAAPSLDAATAEEIVQDVFVAAWRSAAIVRPGARERANLALHDRAPAGRQRAAAPQPAAAHGTGRRRRRSPRAARSGAGPVGRALAGPPRRDPSSRPARAAGAREGRPRPRLLRRRAAPRDRGTAPDPARDRKSRIRSGVARRCARRLGTARRRGRRRRPRRPARLTPRSEPPPARPGRTGPGDADLERGAVAPDDGFARAPPDDARHLPLPAGLPDRRRDALALPRGRARRDRPGVGVRRRPLDPPRRSDPRRLGRARLIAEDPALSESPDRLVVTRETRAAGRSPAGRTMVSWEADRK